MTTSQPQGFLAEPSSGEGPGVLVLHAWWGLNGTIKDICQRLADNGYTAFAPDLYHGQVTDQIAEAETLAGSVFENLDLARAEAAEAAKYLYDHLGSPEGGLAVMGFSLGAFFALELSTTLPDIIRSVVAFYGTGPTDFSASKAAYLCHFAEHDEFEPQESVDALAAALKGAIRPMTFHTYPGTGHWFFEPDRPDAYDQMAAGLAWERTLAFLRDTIKA